MALPAVTTTAGAGGTVSPSDAGTAIAESPSPAVLKLLAEGIIRALAAAVADAGQSTGRPLPAPFVDLRGAWSPPDGHLMLADWSSDPGLRAARDTIQALVVTATEGGQLADRRAPEPTGTDSAAGGRSGITASPNLAALRSTGSSARGSAETGSVMVAAPAAVSGAVTTTAIGSNVVLAGRNILALALGTWTWGQLMSPNSTGHSAIASASTPFVGLPAGSTAAPIPVGGREGEPAVEDLQTVPGGEVPFEAPPPVGAGLITQFLPFDLDSLDEPVSRFLSGLANETVAGIGEKGALPYSVLWVAAGLAFELTRRWHRHLASPRAMGDWKKVSRTLHGLS